MSNDNNPPNQDDDPLLSLMSGHKAIDYDYDDDTNDKDDNKDADFTEENPEESPAADTGDEVNITNEDPTDAEDVENNEDNEELDFDDSGIVGPGDEIPDNDDNNTPEEEPFDDNSLQFEDEEPSMDPDADDNAEYEETEEETPDISQEDPNNNEESAIISDEVGFTEESESNADEFTESLDDSEDGEDSIEDTDEEDIDIESELDPSTEEYEEVDVDEDDPEDDSTDETPKRKSIFSFIPSITLPSLPSVGLFKKLKKEPSAEDDIEDEDEDINDDSDIDDLTDTDADTGYNEDSDKSDHKDSTIASNQILVNDKLSVIQLNPNANNNDDNNNKSIPFAIGGEWGVNHDLEKILINDFAEEFKYRFDSSSFEPGVFNNDLYLVSKIRQYNLINPNKSLSDNPNQQQSEHGHGHSNIHDNNPNLNNDNDNYDSYYESSDDKQLGAFSSINGPCCGMRSLALELYKYYFDLYYRDNEFPEDEDDAVSPINTILNKLNIKLFKSSKTSLSKKNSKSPANKSAEENLTNFSLFICLPIRPDVCQLSAPNVYKTVIESKSDTSILNDESVYDDFRKCSAETLEVVNKKKSKKSKDDDESPSSGASLRNIEKIFASQFNTNTESNPDDPNTIDDTNCWYYILAVSEGKVYPGTDKVLLTAKDAIAVTSRAMAYYKDYDIKLAPDSLNIDHIINPFSQGDDNDGNDNNDNANTPHNYQPDKSFKVFSDYTDEYTDLKVILENLSNNPAGFPTLSSVYSSKFSGIQDKLNLIPKKTAIFFILLLIAGIYAYNEREWIKNQYDYLYGQASIVIRSPEYLDAGEIAPAPWENLRVLQTKFYNGSIPTIFRESIFDLINNNNTADDADDDSNNNNPNTKPTSDYTLNNKTIPEANRRRALELIVGRSRFFASNGIALMDLFPVDYHISPTSTTSTSNTSSDAVINQTYQSMSNILDVVSPQAADVAAASNNNNTDNDDISLELMSSGYPGTLDYTPYEEAGSFFIRCLKSFNSYSVKKIQNNNFNQVLIQSLLNNPNISKEKHNELRLLSAVSAGNSIPIVKGFLCSPNFNFNDDEYLSFFGKSIDNNNDVDLDNINEDNNNYSLNHHPRDNDFLYMANYLYPSQLGSYVFYTTLSSSNLAQALQADDGGINITTPDPLDPDNNNSVNNNIDNNNTSSSNSFNPASTLGYGNYILPFNRSLTWRGMTNNDSALDINIIPIINPASSGSTSTSSPLSPAGSGFYRKQGLDYFYSNSNIINKSKLKYNPLFIASYDKSVVQPILDDESLSKNQKVLRLQTLLINKFNPFQLIQVRSERELTQLKQLLSNNNITSTTPVGSNAVNDSKIVSKAITSLSDFTLNSSNSLSSNSDITELNIPGNLRFIPGSLVLARDTSGVVNWGFRRFTLLSSDPKFMTRGISNIKKSYPGLHHLLFDKSTQLKLIYWDLIQGLWVVHGWVGFQTPYLNINRNVSLENLKIREQFEEDKTKILEESATKGVDVIVEE